jgi:hypothetical protein
MPIHNSYIEAVKFTRCDLSLCIATVVIWIFIIIINVPCFDAVDFIDYDPIFWTITLWFSESTSPLSEIDNITIQQQCFLGKILMSLTYTSLIHVYKKKNHWIFVFLIIWNIAILLSNENLNVHKGVCNSFIICTVTWWKSWIECCLQAQIIRSGSTLCILWSDDPRLSTQHNPTLWIKL